MGNQLFSGLTGLGGMNYCPMCSSSSCAHIMQVRAALKQSGQLQQDMAQYYNQLLAGQVSITAGTGSSGSILIANGSSTNTASNTPKLNKKLLLLLR